MAAVRGAPGGALGGAPAAEQGVASCWLCGTQQPIALMVADGGPACTDVRWYCRDTQRCTWRWTGRQD
ncbi:MAG: hypothetical protein ACRDNZ_10680 [Streptosporangiaceae bacterium]